MTEGSAPRLSNPWLVLGLLLLISIFNYADRYLVTGLVGPLKAAFHVDDAFMGLLMGPAFVVLFVVMGIPMARLADRSSRVRIIAAGCIVWSACTMATGLATEPWHLALARVGVGVGEACFGAPAYSLLTDYFRPERRGMALAILGLATYFGQIAGQAGGPAIEQVHGWQFAFFGLGMPGVLLGLMLVALVREPPKSAAVAAAGQIPFGEMIGRLSQAPAYLLMMFGFALGTLSGVAFGYWGPELFARSFGVDPAEAKAAFALSFGGAGLLGMLAFGAIIDRLARRSMEWPVRLAAIALASATVLIFVTTWLPSYSAARLIAIPCGLLGGGWSIGMIATLQYILPERFRAAATATFIAATTLLGFLVGPWATGAISDAAGGGLDGLRLGLSVTIPLGLVGALLGLLAVRRVEADRARLAT